MHEEENCGLTNEPAQDRLQGRRRKGHSIISARRAPGQLEVSRAPCWRKRRRCVATCANLTCCGVSTNTERTCQPMAEFFAIAKTVTLPRLY